MRITKEEFLEIYKDLPICNQVDLFYTQPSSDLELLTKYLPSKMWRLNNIYTIVNKSGKRVIFQMNKAQHRTYAASLKHPRIIILKSRQQGISTLWLVSFFDDCLCYKDFSIGLMAQGLEEARKLLERVGVLWQELDQRIKDYIGISLVRDNTSEFGLSNSSFIYIRTSFRSGTLQRLHISEMGKIANKSPDKATETKTGSLQALAQGNTGVVESTAEGDNLFKEMWDTAVTYTGPRTVKDFYPVFLSWIEDPDCSIDVPQIATDKQLEYFSKLEEELGIVLTENQRNFWITQYRELGDRIYQEHPSTPTEAFMATREGTYWSELYFKNVKSLDREIPNLYDPNLDVQVSVDIGMNDTNVLTVFQDYSDGVRIIDEFYDDGKPISYYVDWIKSRGWYKNLVHVILPHDAKVMEHTSGLTRYQRYEELLPGIEITVLPKLPREEGIEMVRQLLSKAEVFIDPKCAYLISCFYCYSKEWDEKRNRWRNGVPDHNEYSNGADSLRYMSIGRRVWTNTYKGRKKVTGAYNV